MAIPCNLLLWGGESWALRTSLLSKLEVFLHRSVIRILGIRMAEVKEGRIRNSEVRGGLFNIPTIQNQIAKRQLTFIGKVVSNSGLQLPTKLLTAWCNHKQKRGRVIHSNKKSIVQHIALILTCVGNTGRTSEWVHYAFDNFYWRYLISKLGNSPKPRPAHEPSPSLSRNENGRYFPPNPPSENETSPPSLTSPTP